MSKKDNVAIRVLGGISLVGILFMIGVHTAVSAFSVLIADDFQYASKVGKNTGMLEYIKASWNYAIYMYKTWQGTYSAEFFAALTSPINNNGFHTLRIMMIVNSLLTFGAILLLVYVSSKHFMNALSASLIIMACVTFAVAEYDAYAEVFNWHVGAMVYSFIFSIALLALSFFILANRKKNCVMFTVLAAVTGFIGMGGSLAISGTVCYAALMLVIFYWLRDGSLKLRNAVMFLAMFAGALINAAAPGNFIRQDAESSAELNLTKSLLDAVQVYKGHLTWLFTSRAFGAIVLILVFCGIVLSDHGEAKKLPWGVVGILGLITPYFTIFPVVLGYQVPWMPNRCAFIATVTFVLAYGNLAVFLGYLSGTSVSKKTWYMVIAFGMAVALLIFGGFSFRYYVTLRHVKGLYEHTYQDHYHSIKALLEDLPNHGGEDVVVDVPTKPEDISYYYCFYLLDEECWINQSLADVYGLNTITNSRYGNE